MGCISPILGMKKPVLTDYLEKADTLEVVNSKASVHVSGQTSRSGVFQTRFPLVPPPYLRYPLLRQCEEASAKRKLEHISEIV